MSSINSCSKPLHLCSRTFNTWRKKSSDLKWIERERKKNSIFFSPEISGWNNEGIPWAILFSVRKHLREKERMREREASPLFFEPPPEIDQLNGSILDILASKHEYFFSMLLQIYFCFNDWEEGAVRACIHPR